MLSEKLGGTKIATQLLQRGLCLVTELQVGKRIGTAPALGKETKGSNSLRSLKQFNMLFGKSMFSLVLTEAD